MKHTFLLDENILFCAIKMVNDRGNDDPTALDLILRILKNCHSIVYDLKLHQKYSRHLDKLRNTLKIRNENIPVDTISIIKSLFYNSEKAKIKHKKVPSVADENNLPRKDIHILRAALHCGAEIIVTTDEKLRNAINKINLEEIKALSTMEAIKFAKEN